MLQYLSKIATFIFFLLFVAGMESNAQDSIQIYSKEKFSLVNAHRSKARESKKMANYSLKVGESYKAIDYYEEYLERKPGDVKTLYKLGVLYYTVRNHKKALITFNKVYLRDSARYPKSQYYYARMLMAKGDHRVALPILERFKKNYKGKDANELKKIIKIEIESCEFALKNKDRIVNVAMKHLEAPINNPYFDFSPLIINDSNILYTSLKASEMLQIGEHLSVQILPKTTIYKARKMQNGQWVDDGIFDPIKNQLSSENLETANGCFNHDTTRFYFNQCKQNIKGNRICHLYYSDLEGKKWGEPVVLDARINLPNYSSSQPTLHYDKQRNVEVLYFVSDRTKGGVGGKDIWFTIYSKEKNKYSTPKNAGKGVNTALNEVTPYYDNKHQTLYFSSDGWPGFGGQDVFSIEGKETTWKAPVNLLIPINSSMDDLHYTHSNDRYAGFLVSNRKGSIALKHEGCCDDIFSFKRPVIVTLGVEGIVKELVSNKPIKNAAAELYIIDPASKEESLLNHQLLDSKGGYFFKLKPDKKYKVLIKKDKFLNYSKLVNTIGLHQSDTIELASVNLVKPVDPVIFESIYFANNSSELTDAVKKGIDTGLYILILENQEYKMEIASHTDNIGSELFNRNLSQRRADAVVDYLLSKGILKRQVAAIGYGESLPIEENDTEFGRLKNSRTELRVLEELIRPKSIE